MLSSQLPFAGSRAATVLWRGLGLVRRYHGVGLLVFWVVVQVVGWHMNQAPRVIGDSRNYLPYAQQIAERGDLYRVHYTRYIGYPLFLSGFVKLGLGRTAMALGQYALAGLGAVALYRAVRRLAHGGWAPALLATFMYIAWPDIQRFNAHLLTESLFTSCLIFSFWAVGRAHSVGTWATALLVLLATVSVRPNGFVALAAALLAVAVMLQQTGRRRVIWLGVAGGLLLAPVAWVLLNKLLGPFNLVDTYQQGMIIFMYDGIRLRPTGPLNLPDPQAAPLWQLAYFIGYNPGYFAQLAFWKLAFFMGFPKPYFSLLHSVLLLSTLPVVYGLAIRGMAQQAVARPMRVYLTAGVLLQAGIVMLTVEDGNARFSAPVLPYVFALAALGAWPILRKAREKLQVAAAHQA